MHLYTEGFGDKWAYPIPSDTFSSLGDAWVTFQEFLNYCNIHDDSGQIRRGLFA